MAFENYNIVSNISGAIVTRIGVDLALDPNGVSNNLPANTSAYVGLQSDSENDLYYVGNIKTSRPLFTTVGSWNRTNIVANGSNVATFGNTLPNPTQILVIVPANKGLPIPGQINETSGSFSLTTTIPGTYTVVFDAFPYKQLSTTITAT